MRPASLPVSRPSRRRVLHALGVWTLAAPLTPAWGQGRQRVTVLTSYPDEVVSRMEAAFERAHPGLRLQVVWRMPHDALPYLLQPQQGGIDVYWSASPRTFAAAKAAGAWQPLGMDRSGLPTHIGRTALADPDGQYTATEVAGYGFAVHTRELARLGLPLPRDWSDLTDPRYAGRLALPIPARVGFAPPLVEIVLQAHGWDAGWALWSQIAGLARFVDRGSTFVTDEVGSGRCVLGLSIDFFVASAIANAGADSALRFVYPRHNGINPGQIAIARDTAQPDAARAFAAFVLSDTGQALLGHADLKKLPARPSVYASLPQGTHNPFAAAAQGDYDFDGVQAQPRLAMTAAVFQQMLVEDGAARAALWARIHRAEANGAGQTLAVQQARRALCMPPLTEAQAADAGLQQRFRSRLEGADAKALLPEESRWRAHSQAAQARADAALKEAGA